MNLRCWICLFVGWLTFQIGIAARADISYSAVPLLKTVSHSQLIVVGRIVAITPDPTRHVSKTNTLPWLVGLNPPGDYVFQVLSALRGKSKSVLHIFLPQIDASAYGNAKPRIDKGTLAILFLTPERDSKGTHWNAADPMRPLLILGNGVQSQLNDDKKDVVTRIVNLALASMSDPVLRCANAYALRDVVHTRIPAALLPYMDDTNKDTQANILACLATNQQVQAIPRIAQLEGKVYREHGGVDTGNGLRAYKTPDAIPFLNPLLFEVCIYTRLAAADALRDIADKLLFPILSLRCMIPATTFRIFPTQPCVACFQCWDLSKHHPSSMHTERRF